MQTERTILQTRNYKAGYQIRTELVDGKEFGGDDFKIKSAYTPEGLYIGNGKNAYFLCKKKGIKPELSHPGNNVCSIGFNEQEQKWYGWSHRAIYGFGIGSKVSKGDCAYRARNKEEFAQQMIDFWKEDDHLNVMAKETIFEGHKGVRVSWTLSENIPNKALRSTISSSHQSYPKKWGKGEWTAKTLADARQMAIDFADDVA